MSYTYKITRGGEIRKRTNSPRLSYEQIVQVSGYLHSIPPTAIASLGYTDSEGDNITLTSDAELECIYDEQGEAVNLHISTKQPQTPQEASLDSPVYEHHVSFAELPESSSYTQLPALEELTTMPFAHTRESLNKLTTYLTRLSNEASTPTEVETYEICKKIAMKLGQLSQNSHLNRVDQMTSASVDKVNITFNSLVNCAKDFRDVLSQCSGAASALPLPPRTSSQQTPPPPSTNTHPNNSANEVLLPVQGPSGV